MKSCEKLSLRVGEEYYGFTIDKLVSIPSQKGRAIFATHNKTGLGLFHFYCDDEENLFSFCFSTIPENDKGIPHILEHSVLSGSKKFPLKDPFLAFSSGSVNTFLNALTAPFITYYPAASILEKDYFNLMELYGDSVFNPLLTKEIFYQEGCRIEIDQKGQPYAKGIVYNEMQGAYSDSEEVIEDICCKALFDGSSVAFDSGGVPKDIINLSYEEFINYYKKHYSPSNCKLYLYGNIDPLKQLEFLDSKILSKLKVCKQDFGKNFFYHPTVPKWNEKKYSSHTIANGTKEKAPFNLILNWLLPVDVDPFYSLVTKLIENILLGGVGAPLYRALMDSKLGQDISSVSGFDDQCGTFSFSLGMKGVKEKNREALEKFILSELTRICENKIEANAIEGALRQFEFSLRKWDGKYPIGLLRLLRCSKALMANEDPLPYLDPAKDLARLRRVLKNNPRFLEEFIESNIINNNQCAVVWIKEEPSYQSVVDSQIQKALTDQFRLYQKTDKDFPHRQLKEFYQYQNRPEDTKVLEKIPHIKKSDFPHLLNRYHLQTLPLDLGSTLTKFTTLTNDICYFSIIINLDDLSANEKMLLSMLSDMMIQSSLPSMSLVEVGQKISLLMGKYNVGFESGSSFGVKQGAGDIFALKINFEATTDYFLEALDFVFELVQKSNLGDKARLEEYILSNRNDAKLSLSSDCLSYAIDRCATAFTESAKNDDYIGGLLEYGFLELIYGFKEAQLNCLVADLEKLRNKLLDPNRLSFFLAASGTKKKLNLQSSMINQCNKFLLERSKIAKVCRKSYSLQTDYFDLVSKKVRWKSFLKPKSCELFYLPIEVAYNVLAIPCMPITDPHYASARVLAKIISNKYLWQNVRMKGGAYGSHCYCLPYEGYMLFYSYRDPNISTTFNHFKAALSYYSSVTPSDTEIEDAVVAILSHELRPLRPKQKSLIAYGHKLYNITHKERKRAQEALLNVTKESIVLASRYLLKSMESASATVFCKKSQIEVELPKLKAFGFDRVKTYRLG